MNEINVLRCCLVGGWKTKGSALGEVQKWREFWKCFLSNFKNVIENFKNLNQNRKHLDSIPMFERLFDVRSIGGFAIYDQSG
jgi:hypothetical protein